MAMVPRSIDGLEVENSAKDSCRHFKVQESINCLLARANRHVASVICEESAPYGITPTQFVVLMHLDGRHCGALIRLSQETGIDRTTIAGVVHRLEKKGFVSRLEAPGDRRAYRVILTDCGLKLKNDLCSTAERVRSKLMTKISAQGYEELARLLARLVSDNEPG